MGLGGEMGPFCAHSACSPAIPFLQQLLWVLWGFTLSFPTSCTARTISQSSHRTVPAHRLGCSLVLHTQVEPAAEPRAVLSRKEQAGLGVRELLGGPAVPQHHQAQPTGQAGPPAAALVAAARSHIWVSERS